MHPPTNIKETIMFQFIGASVVYGLAIYGLVKALVTRSSGQKEWRDNDIDLAGKNRTDK